MTKSRILAGIVLPVFITPLLAGQEECPDKVYLQNAFKVNSKSRACYYKKDGYCQLKSGPVKLGNGSWYINPQKHPYKTKSSKEYMLSNFENPHFDNNKCTYRVIYYDYKK